MIIWAPVFHVYQPPTQFPAVLKRICDESYRPLVDLLGEFEQFWWASRRPMFDLNMIERGLEEQRAVVINAMKAVTLSKVSRACREAAEDHQAIAEDLSRRVRRHVFAA